MSIKSAPYYWVECDWEDCTANAQEYGDYAAWKTADAAVEEAEQSEWLTVHSADGSER